MNIAEGIQLDRVLRALGNSAPNLSCSNICSIIRRMGWQNPPLPWSELERRLAGRPPPANQPPEADGGDAPAWSSKRHPYQPPPATPVRRDPGGRGRLAVSYAELHCHSNASFLDGGPIPRSWRRRRRVSAWRRWPSPTTTACTGSSASPKRPGPSPPDHLRGRAHPDARRGPGRLGGEDRDPDPAGEHLVVLARGPEGYARLSRAISEAQMAGAKGRPGASWGGWPGCTAGTGWS